MSNLSSRAKSLALRLRREHRHRASWRAIAKGYPPIIKPGTLNRIAVSLKREGEQWYPKNENILLALGLIKPRKPRKPAKQIHDMNRDELLMLKSRLEEKLINVNDALDQI